MGDMHGNDRYLKTTVPENAKISLLPESVTQCICESVRSAVKKCAQVRADPL